MRLSILLTALLAVGSSTPGNGTRWTRSLDQANVPDSVVLSDLVSHDWEKVERAKLQIESQGEAYIPALIGILERGDVVPLTNTADLIYPGAKTFYGHGFLVDYDLDRIAVRAGWVLEETAFENLGFSEGAIREADLLQAAMDGKSDKPLVDVLPARRDAESRMERVREAIGRAKAWWAAVGSNWTRFAALKAALTSRDATRQLRALGWLRYGKTQCRGLSPETFARDRLPCVHALTSSPDEGVREQAKLLASDHEGWWWKNKTGT